MLSGAIWALAYAIVGFMVFMSAMKIDKSKQNEYFFQACLIIGLCWPVLIIVIVCTVMVVLFRKVSAR